MGRQTVEVCCKLHCTTIVVRVSSSFFRSVGLSRIVRGPRALFFWQLREQNFASLRLGMKWAWQVRMLRKGAKAKNRHTTPTLTITKR